MKRFSIEELPVDMYNHILELNLQMAKREHCKARPVEKMGNVVVLERTTDRTCEVKALYGEWPSYLNCDLEKVHFFVDVARFPNCIIDEETGKVIKNRYGDQENI